MKTEYILIPLFLIVILLGYFLWNTQQQINNISQSDTTVVIDTQIVHDSLLFYLPVQNMTLKTVTIDSTKYVNLDSLFQEALSHWKDSLLTYPKNYVAEKDTVIKDSLVSVKLSIHSPIPIHPKTYLDAKITTKIPIITETITITNTVVKTPLITYGIQGGLGYDMINDKFAGYVGFGLQLNLGSIF